MAVQANRLTARSVLTIKAPGRHADGGNLYLHISPTGAKSWVFLFKMHRRQRELGLGPLRDVSLARARELATQHRQSIRDGIDPFQARAALSVKPTFGAFADAYIERMQSGWRSPKHVQQWRLSLNEYASKIRGLRIDEIGTAEVLSVLTPMWTSKPETASRLRGRIELVLHAATASGLREGSNPAAWAGHLKALLPQARPKGSRGNFAAMPIDEVPGFVVDLCKLRTVPAYALRFLILTAARSGEVFGADWSEIDLPNRAWTVPATRMKAAAAHRVPLSDPALEVLHDMRTLASAGLIFRGPRTNAMLANTALTHALKSLRPGLTVHGFRSSFRDWAAERTGFPSEVCEAALAHVIPSKVEAAYRRSDLFQKRRALMEAWAVFVGSGETDSKVVALSSRQPATA